LAESCSTTRVAVRDLPLMADIGINPDEIGTLQPLVVSITLLVDPVTKDMLGATIDYRRVHELARMLAEKRIGLIETFGAELARSCLAFDHVRQAEVTIDKPRALPTGMASVTISMSK
jgi:dihydroneopterin aldolase